MKLRERISELINERESNKAKKEKTAARQINSKEMKTMNAMNV